MLFNSLEFCIFFPIVTLLYFSITHQHRWFLLLTASCIFYMAFIPIYIFILIILITVDYFAGILIESSSLHNRKYYLIFSIIANCAFLFTFKYFNFFNSNISNLASFLHLNYPIGMLNIILPIGLSFHTFQSLSYVIEVYRGNQKAEHKLGIYALYVMFYPQLVAGPIERPGNLIHQFYEKHEFEFNRVSDGLKLMIWGLFKKVVVSDNLALFVNQIFDQPQKYDGISLLTASIFFSFQIYCDFSGYSDIAIGSAQVMGFRIRDNFNRPYLSKSISEFWTRWHISLSSWFRDYLYIPLGGNRVSSSRHYFNLFITFLVSGLWHGANWTFIIWGGLHGFYVISGIITKNIRKYISDKTGLSKHIILHKYFSITITFILVTIGWIFFRAKNAQDAFYILSHLFTGYGKYFSFLTSNYILDGYTNLFPLLFDKTTRIIFICFFSIIFMETIHFIQPHDGIRHMLSGKPFWFRWLIYYALMMGILFLGVFGQNQFIYFQF